MILQKLMFCSPLFFMEVENVPVADGVVACLNCFSTKLRADNCCQKRFFLTTSLNNLKYRDEKLSAGVSVKITLDHSSKLFLNLTFLKNFFYMVSC